MTKDEITIHTTNALRTAGGKYAQAQAMAREAQLELASELMDLAEANFPIVKNPWHKVSYHPVWEGGGLAAIDIVQTYSDEHGSNSETFRVNLLREF